MFFRLLLLFTLVPLLELVLLLWLSAVTGWEFTLLLVVVTGVVGARLAQQQGWRTWQRIREQMTQGQPPTGSLVDALLIAVAGALLLTPGVLTDLVGFGLLIPPLREALKRRVAEHFRNSLVVHYHASTGDFSSDQQGRRDVSEQRIIEVEASHRKRKSEQ